MWSFYLNVREYTVTGVYNQFKRDSLLESIEPGTARRRLNRITNPTAYQQQTWQPCEAFLCGSWKRYSCASLHPKTSQNAAAYHAGMAWKHGIAGCRTRLTTAHPPCAAHRWFVKHLLTRKHRLLADSRGALRTRKRRQMVTNHSRWHNCGSSRISEASDLNHRCPDHLQHSSMQHDIAASTGEFQTANHHVLYFTLARSL